MTHFTTPLGSAMYRAPELNFGGTPTALADTYSLGVLLYQLVSGNFNEPLSPGWEQKIPDPLLRRDIADAANLDPARRIQTVAELAARLRNFERRREEQQQQDRFEAEAASTQEALARARMLRPWVVLAIASLAFGLVVALWGAFRAVHERDAAKVRNATLAAMYNFLATDLLGQSNPYLGVAGSGRVPQQTLLDAIATAEPNIDRRFSHQPEIAGRLHETLADSLRSRTRFPEADREYALAAQRFRQEAGKLSQQAITAELKREFAGLSAVLPGSVEAASEGFQQQERLIAQLRHPTVELQAWETLVKTGLIGMGPHPEQGLPLITAAVQRAQATPGFDSTLLVRLKNQFCGTFVRLGDGANLERVSQEIIHALTQQHGAQSATLFPFQMYLEEAFFLQGKYPETVAQADQNFTRFDRVLGRQHQLTLATLATRAVAEGQLEHYADAIRDDLALNAAEHLNPSGQRLELGSLNDAATFECRNGDFRSGIQHARDVMRKTAPGPLSQPMFFNGSMFTLAECIVAGQEVAPARRGSEALNEAEDLLGRVDVKSMSETSDESAYRGAKDVLLARLAILKGQFGNANRQLAAATASLSVPHPDPYELRAFQRAKQTLARQTHAK